MKITDAQKQSYLIQEMGKAGVFGYKWPWERDRFKILLKNLTATPPEGCKFKVGDEVVYVNDHKRKFKVKVLGFTTKPEHPDVFIYLNNQTYWYAVGEDSIQLA